MTDETEQQILGSFKDIVLRKLKTTSYKGVPCLAIDISYSLYLYHTFTELLSVWGINDDPDGSFFEAYDAKFWEWFDENESTIWKNHLRCGDSLTAENILE